MKFFLLLLVLSNWSLAQSSSTLAASQPSTKGQPDPNSQRARSLLNQAIQALGGQAYLNLRDMGQQGRTYSFYHGQSKGGGAPFWRFWKWQDMERIELTKQRDVIYVHNADKGFETTFKGTRPEDPKDLKEFLLQRNYSLENILRRWIDQPGVAFFYEGQSLAASKLADQVTLMNSKDESVTLYLDSATHLPIKKYFTVRDPATREKNEEVEIYDNYHAVQGIQTPFTTARFHNGEMVRQRFVNSVNYNLGLADSLFTPTVTYDPEARKNH